MSKRVFIAEKPSVAREFANSLGLSFRSKDGYMEAEDTIVTWCVGHLVTMCYPDAYDPKYKKWSLSTIPFIPDEYRYQVIDGVKKQFGIVKKILTDKEVDTIYICTDSGREGEYIYRLVAQEAGVQGKRQLRVWIDSQTKEEILRGIKEAKDDSEYDNLGSAAYLRAKEDYLMGINFSRALTLKYGDGISRVLGTKYSVIAVGRVMTCVLGMVVRREREIREFVKTPFYRVLGSFKPADYDGSDEITAEWHAVEGSRYFGTPALYKENGFRERKDAEALIEYLRQPIAAGRTTAQDISRSVPTRRFRQPRNFTRRNSRPTPGPMRASCLPQWQKRSAKISRVFPHLRCTDRIFRRSSRLSLTKRLRRRATLMIRRSPTTTPLSRQDRA